MFAYVAYEDDCNPYGSTQRRVKRTLVLATDGMVLTNGLGAIRHVSELRLQDVPPEIEGIESGWPIYGTEYEQKQYLDNRQIEKANGQLAVLRRELSPGT